MAFICFNSYFCCTQPERSLELDSFTCCVKLSHGLIRSNLEQQQYSHTGTKQVFSFVVNAVNVGRGVR